jgi:hypothetical protein
MKNYFIAFSLVFIVMACKKKKEAEPAQAAVPVNNPPPVTFTAKQYLSMNTGNYWVYQVQQVDTAGVVINTFLDSCYVNDSMVVRGRKFYSVSNNVLLTGYFADSANCIIGNDGCIKYRIGTNNDTISKTSYSQGGSWYNLYYVMENTPTSFSFNGVTYNNCANRVGYFYSNFNPNCPNRTLRQMLSPGVGLVFATNAYASLCDEYQYKLLRYKVN